MARRGEDLGPPKHAAMHGSFHEGFRLQARQHGVVLVGPFVRAALFVAGAAALLVLGWPSTLGAVPLLAAAALIALKAVWRWERTRIVLTSEMLFVFSGTVRRRAAAVRLARIGAVEVEQSFPGTLLGYGTLVAGELEIPYVARVAEISRLIG